MILLIVNPAKHAVIVDQTKVVVEEDNLKRMNFMLLYHSVCAARTAPRTRPRRATGRGHPIAWIPSPRHPTSSNFDGKYSSNSLLFVALPP